MGERLILVLFDSDRQVAEVELAERPSGGTVRAAIRGAQLGKVYSAALTTAEGRTWRYRAEVTSLAGGQAVLTLRTLSVAGVPRWPPKAKRRR